MTVKWPDFVRNAWERVSTRGHYKRKRAIVAVIMKIASYYTIYIYTDFYPIIGHKIQTQYTTGTTFFRITLVEYGKIYH